jgi:biotin transport system substrate-specific component
MLQALSTRATLLDVFTVRAPSRAVALAERAAAAALVTLATAVAAQISIPLPFTPVPFTMQPMVVLVGGAALGARLGAASQMLYLAVGIAGLPVFAAAALPPGAARLLGPTGGYLMSYPLAAFVAGWLAERGLDRRYATSVLAMAAGLAVVFTCGVLWLSFVVQPAAGIRGGLGAGFFPFVIADAIKLAAAGAALPAVWRLRGRDAPAPPPPSRRSA